MTATQVFLLFLKKNCTLEEFTKEQYSIWILKDAYEERFGFYVDYDGDLMNLDNFIRHCTPDIKYYIGGTLDYHC